MLSARESTRTQSILTKGVRPYALGHSSSFFNPGQDGAKAFMPGADTRLGMRSNPPSCWPGRTIAVASRLKQDSTKLGLAARRWLTLREQQSTPRGHGYVAHQSDRGNSTLGASLPALGRCLLRRDTHRRRAGRGGAHQVKATVAAGEATGAWRVAGAAARGVTHRELLRISSRQLRLRMKEEHCVYGNTRLL